MKYHSKKDGITKLVELLCMERIIPIFGSGFSCGMPSHNGNTVPNGQECTSIMTNLLRKYASSVLDEGDLDKMGFNEAAKWFKLQAIEKKNIPESEYVSFYRNLFTEVELDAVRKDILKLPWHNIYTINVDDGIERTGLYHPIVPYKDIREDYGRKDRVFKIHGDANREVNYSNEYNIVFDQSAYRSALNSKENESIRNSILTAYREFNIIFIGCSLLCEPDLEWFYDETKKDRADTRFFYVTRDRISEKRELELEAYGVSDIIKVDDYESFYIDLVYSYSNNETRFYQFPFYNPIVKIVNDQDYSRLYGIGTFIEANNEFNRSDILIDRSVYNQISKKFEKNRIVVLYGRRFSGRTSLICQICKNTKTRGIFYFPSSSSFDYRTVKRVVETESPSLLLFDSNAMQPDVYLGINDLRPLIEKNDHQVLIVEPLEDTYLTETIECETVRLLPKLDENELASLNVNLDRYGLIRRKLKDTNLDYLTRLKEEQRINFPKGFRFPQHLSDVECRLLLVLAAQDKIYSRDIHMMGISESSMNSILGRMDKLCEKVNVNKGESRMQSSYKVVHNSRALIIHLLRNSNGDAAQNVKFLVNTFYQNKDRIQKQIAISIMQFDTLNDVYGGNKGAGKLIEQVYETLQDILNQDSHYWLQRAKSIYRLNPNNVAKLKEAYKYCVKASDGITNTDKLRAQTALSLSLITGLLCKYDSEDTMVYEEECIQNGYTAMNSVYYSSRNGERLNKERADWHQSYEDLCCEICNRYISNNEYDNLKCKNMAFEMLRLLDNDGT